MNPFKSPARVVVCVSLSTLAAALASGCASAGRSTVGSQAFDPPPMSAEIARTLPAFDGTGRSLTWTEVLDLASASDVIVVGEQHDDPGAHAIELALVEDLLDRHPGSMVSMEMLERHEQADLDAYLADEIDLATFIERTGSARWSGSQRWEDSYGRLVEAAKARGGRVVAANAPRKYVRRARVEGYEALESLPEEERVLFDLPERLDEGAYRERFREIMTSMREANGNPPPSEESIENLLRSQMVWDATMAASIANALADPDLPADAKVVHAVGRFHSDFEGGTILELARLMPEARILVVSVTPDGVAPGDEDLGRADVLVFGGATDPD